MKINFPASATPANPINKCHLGSQVEGTWVHMTTKPEAFVVGQPTTKELCVSSFNTGYRFYTGTHAVVFQTTVREWFRCDQTSSEGADGLLAAGWPDSSPYDEGFLPVGSVPVAIFGPGHTPVEGEVASWQPLFNAVEAAVEAAEAVSIFDAMTPIENGGWEASKEAFLSALGWD